MLYQARKKTHVAGFDLGLESIINDCASACLEETLSCWADIESLHCPTSTYCKFISHAAVDTAEISTSASFCMNLYLTSV
jgi:hypothetical protein